MYNKVNYVISKKGETMEKAKIVSQMNLHELHSRLNRENVYHLMAMDDIEDAIYEKQKQKLSWKPNHTNNVGTALGKAFLQESIKKRRRSRA